MNAHAKQKESQAHRITEYVPGGNGARLRRGVEPARRSPVRGERTGVRESIEAMVPSLPKESHTHCITLDRPRREWSRLEASDIDRAQRRAEGRDLGKGESIEGHVCLYPKSLQHVALRSTSPAGIEPTFKV